MDIVELCDENWAHWDAYVRSSPHGLPQHLAAWREVLTRTYGYKTCYLMAVEGRQVAGVLPLFVVPSRLTGHTVTTLPGGLCAESPEVAGELLAAGQGLAERLGARRLVLHDTRRPWPGPFQTSCEHEAWIVDLGDGEEALWRRLDRNIRRQIRMGRNNGLEVEVDRSGRRLDDFYRVLSRFTHQVGTPVFGRSFLENIIRCFPGSFNIVMAYHQGVPIGGYFQMEMGDTVYGLWGATLHDYLALRPVYLAYWTILADAIAQGFRFLDMGRSPADTNTSRFKGQWGGSPVPVYQQVAPLASGQAATSANGRPAGAMAIQVRQSGLFQAFQQLWPRLPFPLAQFLGPRLRRHVPFA